MDISDVISNVNVLADDGVAIDYAVVLPSNDQEVMSLAVGVVGEIKSTVKSSSTNWVVSIDAMPIVSIWDADTGHLLVSVDVTHDEQFQPLMSCSRDGDRLVACCGTQLNIWNLNSVSSSLEFIRMLQPSTTSICSISMNFDGSCIAIGYFDGYIRACDVESGTVLWYRDVHDGPVLDLDISADGNVLASIGVDERIVVCLVATGQEVCQFEDVNTAVVTAIKFNPDASRIASCSGENTIRIWDVAGRSEDMLLRGHTDLLTSLSYSPDGTRLASGSYDHSVRVWDMQSSGECLYVLLGHTNVVKSVSFSNDGCKIVSGSLDRQIVIWDSTTGCEITRWQHEHNCLGVYYLPMMSTYMLK